MSETSPAVDGLSSLDLSQLDSLLIDLLPAAVYVCEAPTGVVVRYNERAAELWGRRPRPGDPDERFCGSHRLYWTDGRPLPHAATPMVEVLRTGVPVLDQEVMIERPDGSRIVALVNIHALRNASGRVIGAVNAFQDIKDRHRVADALRRSEQRFRQLLERLPAAAYTCDRDGRITYFNQQAVELWGRAPRLDHPEDRYCGSFRLWSTDGDPIPHDRCWTAVSLTGEDCNGREIVIERPDGTRRTALAHASPIHDGSGAVVGAVDVLVDVSSLKETERALRASEQHLRAVLDATPECVKIVSADARLTAMNPAGLRMIEADDFASVEGAPILSVVAPEDRAAFEAMHRRVCAGEPTILEFDVIGLRGTRRSMETHAVPLERPDGATVHLAITRDVTARRRLEAELRQHIARLAEADRRKDEFLATLSHELRNPLAPIRNALEALARTSDPAVVRQLRERMERQVAHLVRLVDDLLEVSRITLGKIELRKERVDLGHVIGLAIEAQRPHVDGARHELSVRLPAGPLPVDGDPVRLAQVIGNLVHNAAKYTEEGGRIAVEAEVEGAVAVVRVRDNGVGISPELLPRVFELFAQADHAHGRAQGGLGIGLTLVRTLVELHGGSVEAHSDGPGRGSTFVVRLPLASDAARAEAEAEGPAATPAPGRRVLVVDDNRDAADSLHLLLTFMGHDVRVAYDGPSALRVAIEHRPAVVLLDLGMPGQDGFSVARSLRASLPDPPKLVALTGWGQDEDRRRTQAAGFDHHLVKPVDADALAELLTET